jgi:hypothetical protein
MALETDNGPGGVPSDLSTTWTTALYDGTTGKCCRASSRYRVRVSQGGPRSWNHVYGFGKTGTVSARGPQPFNSATWAANQNVELSWTSFGADQTTTVWVTLTSTGTDTVPITSWTVYPKHLNIVGALDTNELVLQVPVDTRLYIEINGRKDALAVFADPLGLSATPTGYEIHTVTTGNISSLATKMTSGHPNVIGPAGSVLVVDFPPGVWELPTSLNTVANPGGSTNVTRELDHMLMPVRPFTKVNLQRGAWVIGSWDLRNSNDVALSGPGTLSGEWATWSDINNKLQGSGNLYQNPGQALNFNEQIAWAAICGTLYDSNEDYSFPSMSLASTVLVGHPYYTLARGIGTVTRAKIMSHFKGNNDGLTGIAVDAMTQAATVDKCILLSGDDGLNRDNNFGTCSVTNSHAICWGGAPLNLGYWPEPATGLTAVIQNLTLQSNAEPNIAYGNDLYTGINHDNPGWGAPSNWATYGPWAAPHSYTESIIKCWMDGNDAEPPTYGRFNLTLENIHVEGVVPRALFTIENCYYPFTATPEDKSGNASNWEVRNITCEQVPQYRSRLIGRDKRNTPHDIRFSNITIAGTLLTVLNYDQYVWQNSTPYNIFVEGRCVVTALDICNLALSHIGESAVVQSIAPPDGTTQASLCNQFYNRAVEELLEMHAWSFATARSTLAETATNEVDGWGYSYTYPTSVLKTLQVIPEGEKDRYINPLTREPNEFTVEQNAAGTMVLYTDVEDAEIRYTKFVYTPGYYPPLFITALSWLLASKLAGPIMKGDVGAAESKRCLQMVQFYVGKAAASDSHQKRTDTDHKAPWISNR